MKYKRQTIIDIFTKLGKESFEIWFSGKKSEGEYKRWHKNGHITEHGFFKNGKDESEYKMWYIDGQIWVHGFYRNGKRDGEFKFWNESGHIAEHSFYKNDKKIKMPKNIKKGYIYADGKYWKD